MGVRLVSEVVLEDEDHSLVIRKRADEERPLELIVRSEETGERGRIWVSLEDVRAWCDAVTLAFLVDANGDPRD